MEKEQHFFDFAAHVGLTKHLGGLEATEEMVELCHIGPGSYVLDVGCGAGQTSALLAKRYGCRVAGVDINAGMVERSKERAKREGVEDRIEFRVADAQELPFEDNLFDAVITESVTAFPEDKQKAVNEYFRVTKPGGYVGLNESTWTKYPPTQEMLDWVSQDLGANVMPLTEDEWRALLEKAGAQDIIVMTSPVDVKDESRGLIKRYGCGGMLGILSRTFGLYLKNPAYRAFVKKTQEGGVVPENLTDYFGYGMYVGRK